MAPSPVSSVHHEDSKRKTNVDSKSGYHGQTPLQQKGAPRIPDGFIEYLGGGRFRVTTTKKVSQPCRRYQTQSIGKLTVRQRCSGVFVGVVQTGTIEEADRFFRAIDQYDKHMGPMHRLRRKWQDLCWTFVPPAKPSGMRVAKLKQGREFKQLNAASLATVAAAAAADAAADAAAAAVAASAAAFAASAAAAIH